VKYRTTIDCQDRTADRDQDRSGVSDRQESREKQKDHQSGEPGGNDLQIAPGAEHAAIVRGGGDELRLIEQLVDARPGGAAARASREPADAVDDVDGRRLPVL